MIFTFFRLVMGHAVADFGLQSEAMAKGKNRNNRIDPSLIPPGQTYDPYVWLMYLTAHALIHGAAVFIVTGSHMLALLVVVTHLVIDFGKCENLYGPTVDQLLHLLVLVLCSAYPFGMI